MVIGDYEAFITIKISLWCNTAKNSQKFFGELIHNNLAMQQ